MTDFFCLCRDEVSVRPNVAAMLASYKITVSVFDVFCRQLEGHEVCAVGF